MTVEALLARLSGVKKTKEDSWSACCPCPAHGDKRPSLSLRRGPEGRVLLRCFAGCPVEEVVQALGLRMRDLFAEPKSSGKRDVRPAADITPLATWLAGRGLPASEISRMFGTEGPNGAAVVFPYLDESGSKLYEKFRSLQKEFYRKPAGKRTVFYGLEQLLGHHESVIITEGELDAHALRAVGLLPVISVPDGTGSALSDQLLAPLARFRDVVLATDADPPGEAFGRRLAAALGIQRCRRLVFRDEGHVHKDACEALKAGWTRERFHRALGEAPPMASDATAAPLAAPTIVRPVEYEVHEGGFCVIRLDRRSGQRLAYPISDFTAEIVEEVAVDDGEVESIKYRIRGRRSDGTALRTLTIAADDFGGMSWLSKWGHGALVLPGQSARENLRVAIHRASRPERRAVYAHTGWRDLDGRMVFLHAAGAIGADGNVSVELKPPLDRFVLPQQPTEVKDAIRWSLRLLDCAPAEVAVPILAAIYLAPLSSILPPDFTVWILAPSGFFKTEFSALAQRHFGPTFDRSHLPGSWNSTYGSLEALVSRAKDVLFVIDDFPPQADKQKFREQCSRVEEMLRAIGNRAGKGRLNADLTQRCARPPRGLVLSSGEDLPVTGSIKARLVVVEINRKTIDTAVLTELQNNGHRFCHAMAAYLTHLRPRLDELGRSLPKRVQEIRASFQQEGQHPRLPNALAMLAMGFELLIEFALSERAIDGETAQRYLCDGRRALAGIAERQPAGVDDLDVAEQFMEVLRQEIACGRTILRDAGAEVFAPAPGVQILGLRERGYAFVFPDVARAIVGARLRSANEAFEISTHMLHKQLAEKGYVVRPGKGRVEVQRDMGAGVRARVLKMPLDKLLGQPPAGSTSGSSPTSSAAGSGVAPRAPNVPFLNGPPGGGAPVTPVSPLFCTGIGPEER